MRLHSLSVTAFGPFSDTVVVDFDALSDAGLFLLCGPTGAGKSSVLDAVCFALYGEVPGDRSSARRLRCDTAAAGVPPQVFLDVTLGTRQFHLTRSPAWQRPKKRGDGTTGQQASIVVLEVIDGSPVHLTNRLDEAGHLISGLLGMNLPQFTQVAMLPQGRFQDFLRAKSEDRHTLLQQLFRTRRFEDVERWLRDRRISLRRESEDHCDQVTALAHRLDEVSGSAFAAEVDHAVITAGADDGSLGRWAGDLAESARRAVQSARATLTERAEAEVRAFDLVTSGRTCAEKQQRRTRAVAELDRLDADPAAVARRQTTAARAHLAAPVAAVHQQSLRARSRFEDARSAARAAEETAPTLVAGGLQVEDLTAAVTHARDRAAQARALLPVEAEARELATRIRGLEAEERALDERVTALTCEVSTLPATVSAAAERVERGRASTQGLLHARERLAALEGRAAALDRASAARARLVEARDLLRASVDAHQALREGWLHLQERRLNGMAAEIAVALAVGASCPVCGSCEHPRPATPTHDAPNATDERAARKLVDDADVIREAHADQVRSLETTLAVAQEQTGGSAPADLALERASARESLARLRGLAAGLEAATAAHEEARAAQQRAETSLAGARVERVSVTTSVATASERLARVQHSLAGVLSGHHDLAEVIGEHEREASAAAAILETVRVRDSARSHDEEARGDLHRAALEAGFADAEDAVSALLPPGELATLEAALREHHAARAGACAVVDDPDLAAASALPTPDVGALEAAHATARAALADAEAAHRRAVQGAGRIEALRTQLVDALARWAPVRASHAQVAGVAGFAEGKSVDNRAQMRLSAYVLSWRLGQVVDAANLRLAGMTDQRYALEHTARKGAGETRGGLSLVVRDDWSGESRDPVTLSGGETFVVSLALALGLTDVVTQEAGGADIGTLFVDEGFGSLDAETLDDVMDTLDSLREGGRVVGIVSHVPELRTRIPAQLQVGKSRSGSSVRQVHLSA